MSEIFELSALEMGSRIKSGELDAVQVTEAFIGKISKNTHNAYITVFADSALARAKKVQAAIKVGEYADSPLAGVPIAVKDNICTLGEKTSCASKIMGDFKPPYNATVMDKLEAAGAVLLGKTNMDEFAMGSTTETSFYGPVKNPWNAGRVPGGSSGGSAAAVAAGEAVYALGTDTGGSIRQPSSFCGVTGMKPTYGTVSRYGAIAYASSLDQIGPIAKTAEDCAAVLDVISGKDRRDATSLEYDSGGLLASLNGDIKGLKIGMPSDCFGNGLDGEVKEKILETARTLEGLGAEVDYFPLPVIEYAVPVYYIVASAEASSNLSRFDGVKYGFRAKEYEDIPSLHKNTRAEGFGGEVQRRIMLGTFVLSTGYYDAYYKKALQVKAVIKRAFDSAFEKFDLILCPVSPATAPVMGESLKDPLKMYLGDIYTASVNLAGLPAISVPCGLDGSGMPVGAQLIGKALAEKTVLNAAYAFQQATDFHKMTPKGGAAI